MHALLHRRKGARHNSMGLARPDFSLSPRQHALNETRPLDGQKPRRFFAGGADQARRRRSGGVGPAARVQCAPNNAPIIRKITDIADTHRLATKPASWAAAACCVNAAKARPASSTNSSREPALGFLVSSHGRKLTRLAQRYEAIAGAFHQSLSRPLQYLTGAAANSSSLAFSAAIWMETVWPPNCGMSKAPKTRTPQVRQNLC